MEKLPGPDGGVDAGAIDGGVPRDGGSDAGGLDAGRPDSGVDAGSDAGLDGGTDAGVDAGIDGGRDAGTDAGFDAGVDAGTDAGVDAGPVVACTTGAMCLSNLCLSSSGDCFNCQSDSECGGGRKCGTGVCEPTCTNSLMCGAGRDCCAGRCVDLQRDPSHCGVCTTTCDAESFCGRGQCRPTTFAQLCHLPLATVLLDGTAGDADAGIAMAQQVVMDCIPTVTARLVGQDDAGVLRNTDGAPIALGELLVMGGGSYLQSGIRYLEGSNRAEVKDSSTLLDAIYTLKDGGVASSLPVSMLGPTHDRLIVQLVRAPSGSVVLNAAGFYGPGTLAAATAFVQQLWPMRASLTTRWYVFDWQDTDVTPGPSAGDTFTVIASGP